MAASIETLKQEIVKIMKNSQYGLLAKEILPTKPRKRICNDVYLSDYYGGEITAVIGLFQTKVGKAFDGSDIESLGWETIRNFDDESEARIYCDVSNLHIGSQTELKAKYKVEVDRFNERFSAYFKQSVIDTDFTRLYPHSIKPLVIKMKQGGK